MEKNLKEDFYKWKEYILNYKLPRWDDLPDIGYYMDQVIEFTEKHLSNFSTEESGKLISPSIINNYVKHKIIPAPVKKRYFKEQIALLIIVCILKPVIPISSIQSIINYELETKSLENLYNSFCTQQEKAYVDAINNSCFSKENANETMCSISLKMSILSSSYKVLAHKTSHTN